MGERRESDIRQSWEVRKVQVDGGEVAGHPTDNCDVGRWPVASAEWICEIRCIPN